MLTRRGAIAGAATLVASHARAQVRPAIRIGMLQDASGPYSHLRGRLSPECARQAILDQADTTGVKQELIPADHRNSPDLGLSIARQWMSEGEWDLHKLRATALEGAQYQPRPFDPYRCASCQASAA